MRLSLIEDVRSQKVHCGFMGFMNNKGGTAISFDIGDDKFLCIGSHLACKV